MLRSQIRRGCRGYPQHNFCEIQPIRQVAMHPSMNAPLLQSLCKLLMHSFRMCAMTTPEMHFSQPGKERKYSLQLTHSLKSGTTNQNRPSLRIRQVLQCCRRYAGRSQTTNQLPLHKCDRNPCLQIIQNDHRIRVIGMSRGLRNMGCPFDASHISLGQITRQGVKGACLQLLWNHGYFLCAYSLSRPFLHKSTLNNFLCNNCISNTASPHLCPCNKVHKATSLSFRLLP
ncbi:hypothetical protein D3C73_801160 [compost metagenome]